MGATLVGGGAIGVGGAFAVELSSIDLTDTDGFIVSSSADDTAGAGAGAGTAGFGTGADGGVVGAGAAAAGGSLLVTVSGNILRIIVDALCGFVSASGGGGGGIGTGGFRAGARVVDEATSGLVVAEVDIEDEELVDFDVDFEVELLLGNAV